MDAETRTEHAKLVVALSIISQRLGSDDGPLGDAQTRMEKELGEYRKAWGLPPGWLFAEELKIVQDSGDVIG